MSDPLSDPEGGTVWLPAALVALFGGLGGLTAWVWSVTVGTPLPLEHTGAIAANVFLGMVAGFVGTYAIKLSSSRVLMHSLALALLCGFAWKPMLEAGKELVTTRLQESGVSQRLDEARKRIEDLKSATPETAPSLIEELQSTSQELLESKEALRNPRLEAQVDELVRDSVLALGDAAQIAPEAGAKALGSLGSAALREDSEALSTLVADKLLPLAKRKDFDVDTSSEVSNALARLSAAARAEQREDKAEAFQMHGREILEQAERRNPQASRELRSRSLLADELPPPP